MDINSTILWTAVITPLLDSGRVDYRSLENVLKQQEKANNGILILGSTGEALNLSENERKSVLEFTLNLKLNSPIMCGVGGSELDETKSWLSYLEGLNIDCYLMVTPLYAKPGRLGQYYWFKSLMDQATKPVVLYNVPSRTGISLNFETVEMLKSHKNLWAIKEASGSTQDFKKYADIDSKIKVFSGDDALLPDFTPLGAKGLISVASNVWPSQTNLYVQQCLTSKIKNEDIIKWKSATNSLFLASNPIPAKRMMEYNKDIASATTKLPLHHMDLETLAPIIEEDRIVNSWYSENK